MNLKTLEFWAPIIFSIPVTIVLLLLALGSAGVGHGSGLLIIVLFPYSLLVVALAEWLGYKETSLFFIVPLILQFPLYGVAVALAREKRKLALVATTLVLMHLLGAGYIVYYAYFRSATTLSSYSNSENQGVVNIELEWPSLGSPDHVLYIDLEKLEKYKVPDTERDHFSGTQVARHDYDYIGGIGEKCAVSTYVMYYPRENVFYLIGNCRSIHADLPVGPFRGDPRQILPGVTSPR